MQLSPRTNTEQPRLSIRLSRVWRGALARDLKATGPVGRTSLAEERLEQGTLERVYRVETKEMVDYFTVRYGASDAVDSVALYHEY